MSSLDTDRWLTDGDCTKCRRREYCAKTCRASKLAMQRDLQEMVNRLLKEKTGMTSRTVEEMEP